MPDIGDTVQSYAVLRGPAADYMGLRIVNLGKLLKFLPAASFFTGAVATAAQKQKVSVAAETETFFIHIQIHARILGRIFQCKYVGTLLILFQKIQSVLVVDGEVCGNDDLICSNFSRICDCGIAFKCSDCSVLVNMQFLCNCSTKL